MDHEVVVRDKITERYLLEELDPQLRDEFEDHFFDCPECAFDVRAGAAFVRHSKVVLKELAEEPEAQKAEGNLEKELAYSSSVIKPNRGWFAWLKPAFAVPAMALLLVVVGYQNLVTLPNLGKQLHQPHMLPAITLNLLTYGANSAPQLIHDGEGFLLNVIRPRGHHYPAYRVDLYNPSGEVESSIAVKDSLEDTWSISFPEAKRQSGTYKLEVHGITNSGQGIEVGSSTVELQVQK
jgi:hypothetical protein